MILTALNFSCVAEIWLRIATTLRYLSLNKHTDFILHSEVLVLSIVNLSRPQNVATRLCYGLPRCCDHERTGKSTVVRTSPTSGISVTMFCSDIGSKTILSFLCFHAVSNGPAHFVPQIAKKLCTTLGLFAHPSSFEQWGRSSSPADPVEQGLDLRNLDKRIRCMNVCGSVCKSPCVCCHNACNPPLAC